MKQTSNECSILELRKTTRFNSILSGCYTPLSLVVNREFPRMEFVYRAFALILQAPTQQKPWRPCWCSRQKSLIKIILNWNTNMHGGCDVIRLSCGPTFPTFSYFFLTFLLFLLILKNCLIFLLFPTFSLKILLF
jgi:hypothetical protein